MTIIVDQPHANTSILDAGPELLIKGARLSQVARHLIESDKATRRPTALACYAAPTVIAMSAPRPCAACGGTGLIPKHDQLGRPVLVDCRCVRGGGR